MTREGGVSASSTGQSPAGRKREIPRYVLGLELGTKRRMLTQDSFTGDFDTTNEALEHLPDSGECVLEMYNMYHFGRLGKGAEGFDLILFSEQSALKAMRKTVMETREDLLPHMAGAPGEYEWMLLCGETKTGLKIAFCVVWDGLFVRHCVMLSGEAAEVKRFAKGITTEDDRNHTSSL